MIKRVTITLVVFCATLLAADYVLGELLVLYEMWATGATTRTALAGDFGLGLAGLLIVDPASLVVAAICSWLAWRRTGRRRPQMR